MTTNDPLSDAPPGCDARTPSLLATLRERQLTSRTAQIARAHAVPAAETGGAFNAAAAAAASLWRKP